LTLVILKTIWDSAKEVFARAIDGVDPAITKEIVHAVNHTEGVKEITDTRVRWIGHTLHAELNIAVSQKMSIEQAHDIAKVAEQNLKQHVQHLSHVLIHVDPLHSSGEKHHATPQHPSLHVHAGV